MSPAAQAAASSGFRAAIAAPAWIVALSFLGVGSLARDAGHPIGAAMMSTAVVWAAPAQLILYGSLATDGLVLAAAISVFLSAIRLMPMVLAVWPYLRRPGHGFVRQALLAHLVAATTWIEAMRRLPELPEDARIPYYVGFGCTCMILSVLTTGIGFLLVGALPGPFAAALLCLTPIYFTISLVAGARMPGEWAAIAFGLGFLPVAQEVLGRDYDLLATGLIGGTLAYGVHRLSARGAR